jgi:ankyrin repeat protein
MSLVWRGIFTALIPRTRVLCMEMDQFRAAEVGDLQRLQQLLTPHNVDSASIYSSTVLHSAAAFGHVDCVKWCLEMRANVSACAPGRLTPLHFASSNGYVDVVRVLLDSGASIDATSDKGYAPLDLAIQCNRIDAVRFLIDRGAVEVSSFKLNKREPAIPDWVDSIIASRLNCRSISIIIIGAHKYRRTNITGNNDNNVMRLIAKHIWSSRMDELWKKKAMTM